VSGCTRLRQFTIDRAHSTYYLCRLPAKTNDKQSITHSMTSKVTCLVLSRSDDEVDVGKLRVSLISLLCLLPD